MAPCSVSPPLTVSVPTVVPKEPPTVRVAPLSTVIGPATVPVPLKVLPVTR